MSDRGNRTLFRREAIEFAASSTFGHTTVVQPLKVKLLSLFVLLLFALAATYLFFGEYARKATVQGYLEPNKGFVRVFPYANGGVVRKLAVQDGDYVKKGDPLIELSFPTMLLEGEEASRVLIAEYVKQHEALAAQVEHHKAWSLTELQRMQFQIAEIDEEIELLQSFADLQTEQSALADHNLQAMRMLRKAGSTSESEWLRSQVEKIDQDKSLLTIQQHLVQLRSHRNDVIHKVDQLPQSNAGKLLELQILMSQTHQKITELRSRGNSLVVAPQAGLITSLQVKPGEMTVPGKPLLILVPENSNLMATLLLPSRSIGFIRENMSVRMSVDAYPHEQYGTIKGTLASISEAPVAAGELVGLIKVDVPVYLARVRLAQQFLLAFGEHQKMMPGMLIRADIILESRSLIDWLMEPLYSLRGRTR